MNLPAYQPFEAEILELLLPHVWSVEDRKDLLTEAFLTTHKWIRWEIKIDGEAIKFAVDCIKTLANFGTNLLETLLITLRRREGEAAQAQIDRLLLELPAYCAGQQRPAVLPSPRPLKAALDVPGRPQIFLSFADEDAGLAQLLADELARYDHTCLLSRHPQKGSDAWFTATSQGLSNAYAVLLLAGLETWQDRWVKVELLAALDKRKQIIPLLLRKGHLPGFLPPDLPLFALDDLKQDTVQNLLECLPQPPSAAPHSSWQDLSPALLQRADELVYMDRLKLQELRHVAQYTRLGGQARLKRTRGDRLQLPSIVARQELVFTRWRRNLEMPPEIRRFEDAIPELLAVRRAVLLGDPGAGKTTTLYKLAADLLDTAILDRLTPVPLMVALGLWTDPAEPLIRFLRRSVGELGEALEERLVQDRAALLLDGLNEIPAAQQAQKYQQVKDFLAEYPQVMAIVSCREQDYPPERALALDVVTVAPLDPVRIYEFIHNYLDRDFGSQAGDDLFWKIAGKDAQGIYQQFLSEHRFTGGPESNSDTLFTIFWLAESLPQGLQWGYDDSSWKYWLGNRTRPASLLQLAQNPYMLFMLLDVYRTYDRSLPDNRGELFDSFVETLLLRERLFGLDSADHTLVRYEAGVDLLHSLTALAFEMQRRRVAAGAAADALTALPAETVARFLDKEERYQAASANLLALGEEVRFAHQLLQEYFVARAMGAQIFGAETVLGGKDTGTQRLQAVDIWPPERWWEPTNWEEATILLAGLYSDDCSAVVRWAGAANPELAARCIMESGAHTPEETKLALRELWLPRLADMEHEPDPRARAAVGRALGLITLADGQPLDNRPGVGVMIRDGVRIPDITWGEPVAAGKYRIGGDPDDIGALGKKRVSIDSQYRLARFPVTYAQFRCFVGAADFADARWWEGMPPIEDVPVLETVFGRSYYLREISVQTFKFTNHPRESVSWYQAIAFCRWLSDKLGYEVDLPYEHEWEVAARYPDGRYFPWGSEFHAARANTAEGRNLGRTSPVGMYPRGANELLGLYDLCGNVGEWCRNKYDDPQDTAVDQSGAMRVLRGGTWNYDQDYARLASRDYEHPAERHSFIGFRLVARRSPSSRGK